MDAAVEIVRWLVLALGVYLAVGVCFAVPFAIALVGRVDPAARGAGLAFRLLVIPGAAALWPLLAHALLRPPAPEPVEPAPHDDETAA